MTHLLQEVKEELDWAAHELSGIEQQFIALELELSKKIAAGEGNSEALAREIEEKKKTLNIVELHSILSRAARRFSLLARVYEIGATTNSIEGIVSSLTDGLLFRQADTSEGADDAIIQLAEALQFYFHVCFDDSGDEKIRDAWLEVQGVLQKLGRKI